MKKKKKKKKKKKNNNNNESVWKNLLASSLLSLLSLFGVCSNRHRKMAGNRGDEKETRVDWKSKLSLYLSWVVYYSLLVPTRFSFSRNPANAAPTKKIEICWNIFFRRVTQTHTQTYRHTDTNTRQYFKAHAVCTVCVNILPQTSYYCGDCCC